MKKLLLVAIISLLAIFSVACSVKQMRKQKRLKSN